MAALLARAVLGDGLVVEVYEEGEMWLIESSGKRQEIKLEGSAPANLLTFLTKNRDLLHIAAGPDETAQLEATYGPLYRHSQHKRGETIRYRVEGLTYRGQVLWVQAPGEQDGRHLPMRYIVHCDQVEGSGPLTGFVDIVFETDLVREPA